jgi:hypothetical protein
MKGEAVLALVFAAARAVHWGLGAIVVLEVIGRIKDELANQALISPGAVIDCR